MNATMQKDTHIILPLYVPILFPATRRIKIHAAQIDARSYRSFVLPRRFVQQSRYFARWNLCHGIGGLLLLVDTKAGGVSLGVQDKVVFVDQISRKIP